MTRVLVVIIMTILDISVVSSLSCKIGYYAATALKCSPCPAGFTTAQSGATDSTLCTINCSPGTGGMGCPACAAGKFAYFQGATACQTCPAGTGSVSGATLCVGCSSDSTCKTAASLACASCSSGCTACIAGKYNDGSQPHCTACPAGTYSTTIQADNSNVCLACNPGFSTKPTDSWLTVCSSCVALNQPTPKNSYNGTQLSDLLLCQWQCEPGYIPINVSASGFKNATLIAMKYTAAEALAIFHIQNDYCCNPTLTTVGTYLSGCNRTSDGVSTPCPPIPNAYFVDTKTPSINHCSEWACNVGYYLNGTCWKQPACQNGYTYQRDIYGNLVTLNFGIFTCVPCSQCIDGSQLLKPCNGSIDTQCTMCSGTTYSVGNSGCLSMPPLGYIGLMVRLTSVPVFQGRPSFYYDGTPLDWGVLNSGTGSAGFYLNTYTPCQSIPQYLVYSGSDVPCRRLDTVPSMCQYPACNTQCRPWNGTAGWFKLGTGQCTPCVYDSSCGPTQYSDMTVCGPVSSPQCTDCPSTLPANALTWLNPGRSMTGYPPCDVLCRDGFVKTSNYTCIYCPNLPNNSKITSGCNWVCSLGFIPVGHTCVPCTNVPTSCGVGTFLGYNASSQCARCLPCTNVVPNSIFTTAGHDNGPDTCAVVCNPGTFIDPTYGVDVFNNPIVCTQCSVPQCKSGSTYLVSCTLTSDAFCAPCSICPPGKYALYPCTIGADVLCADCDPTLLPDNSSWSVGCDLWQCNSGFYHVDGNCAKCLQPSDCSNSDSYSYLLPGCGICTPCNASLLLPGQCFNGDGQCGTTYWCGFTSTVRLITTAPITTPKPIVTTQKAVIPTTTPKPNVTYAAVMTLTLSSNMSIPDLIKSISCPQNQQCIFKLISVKQTATCSGCRRRLLQQSSGIVVQVAIISPTPLQSSPVVSSSVQSVAITASHPVSDPTLLSNPVQLGLYVNVMEQNANKSNDDFSWIAIGVAGGITLLIIILLIVAFSGSPLNQQGKKKPPNDKSDNKPLVPNSTPANTRFNWEGVRIITAGNKRA